MLSSNQISTAKAIAALCGALVLPSRSHASSAENPASRQTNDAPPIVLRHAAVGLPGVVGNTLGNTVSTSAPVSVISDKGINQPGGESLIDQNMGRASNTLEILSFFALATSAVLGLRFSRRLPHSVIAENFILSKDSAPGFVDAGARRVSELFPNALDRFILYSAASKATPEFPTVYIDPNRHPEILTHLRRFLGSIDADTVVSAMGRSPELPAALQPWNLIIVPRVAYPDDVPVIQLDCFSYASLVRLLKDPISVFKNLTGMNREYALNHFEAAALVAVTSPEVLRKAISEADRLAGRDTTTSDEMFTPLQSNADALLRLLKTCSQRSLEILDEAVASKSLEGLRQRATDQEMRELRESRINQKSFFDRFALPVLEWLWRNPNAERWRSAADHNATTRKCYPFFMVAKMHSNTL